MEASGIGGGAEGVSEATQTGSEAVEQAPARDYGQDIDRLSQTMEQFGSQFSEFLQSQQQPEEPEGEPEPEFNPEDYYEGDTLTAEGLQQMIDSRAQQIAQEQLQPLQEQWTRAQLDQQEQQRAQEADSLEERYPELKDEQYQDQILDMAMSKAQELARRLDDPKLTNLWREPSFLETIHLAEKARSAAENEVPAGSGNGLMLEGGGSLSPSGTGRSADDIGDAIVKARR